VSKEWNEHHLSAPPRIKDDFKTHLYGLFVGKDNNFELSIDNSVVKEGNLLKDMHPPILPPEFIPDPEDIKPNDWVDDKMIPDPNAKKPNDWDEDAPRKIPDPDATKPEGWREDLNEMIPDPHAPMPDEWDEEENGEWQPPQIKNPECAVGCGKWNPPLIDNPKYKGEWKAPMIENPNYKGPWQQKEMKNPHYFNSATPGMLPRISAMGFELWTMAKDIMFDNLIIGVGKEQYELAKKYAELTFEPRKAAEDAALPDMPSPDDSLFAYLSNMAMSFLRMNPALLFVVPLMIIIFMIARRRYKRSKERFRKAKEDRKSAGGADDDDIKDTAEELKQVLKAKSRAAETAAEAANKEDSKQKDTPEETDEKEDEKEEEKEEEAEEDKNVEPSGVRQRKGAAGKDEE